MRKHHYKTLKFHAVYSIILAAIFLIVVVIDRDLILAATVAFFILYITGNGVIHIRKNKLERDVLLEYILLAGVALVVLIGLFN